MKMPDWTSFSDDPNNREAKAAVRAWLPTARRIHSDIDLLGFIDHLVRDHRVLDIGVVSHSARYFDQPDWRHGKIAQAASYCLGLDILAPLVDELNQRGFNVRCVDATSEIDLGERFDVAFIGDVIEHVNDPVGLLSFAGRHLSPEGRLYATTPNPFSRKFFRQFRRSKGCLVANLDHIAWITPTLAMELARRAGLTLVSYHLVKNFPPATRAFKSLAWRFEPPEYSFPDYVYEFARRD
ncbi:MAG: methyltransferase domain-containing protein [Betaproteobacteria bacterium]